MPRGRKGPPQESIDSILLAISRRDDIDPETLSHYFARLEEEWADEARDKVLHLLRSSDPSAHAAAMLILSELATDLDLEELEDFVADPTVSDVSKLTLSPILKELGSEMADEAIIEYLNDPGAAMQQMQLRLLELVGENEMGIESILNDVISMPLEKRLGFAQWLGNSSDPRAAHLLTPLLEGQTGKMVTAVIDALEQLGPSASEQSIPALSSLIATTSNRQIKQQARAALGRLTMQSVPGAEGAAEIEARQQLPIYEARASFVDGTGAQLLMLSWQRDDGSLKVVNVLYQDQWGIKDCYGLDEMDIDQWNGLVANMDQKSFGCYNVPFEYARALVAEARTLNKRTHRKIPIAYFIWRSLIEGDEVTKKHTATVATAFPPQPLDADGLAQHGDKLYEMVEFMSWMYEPIAAVEPYMTRYWGTFQLGDLSSGRRSRGPKSTRKTKAKEKKVLLEELVSEALGTLIDERWRMLYENRLRHQAVLFQMTDREPQAALCGAVASMLHPDSHIPPQEQPFLRTLMRTSIEQGPLRMLAETLSGDDLEAMPFDLLE